MGKYEEHLRAERAKARIWNGIILTPEAPERRDPITHMSGKDEERAWRAESARHMEEYNYYRGFNSPVGLYWPLGPGGARWD